MLHQALPFHRSKEESMESAVKVYATEIYCPADLLSQPVCLQLPNYTEHFHARNFA